MAGVRRFQDLQAWQLATELCVAVFEITSSGPAAADETFQRQIRDAAKSAPSLIAEGFARYTPAEFARFLRMARAELAEVQSNLEVGCRINYFSGELAERTRTLGDTAIAKTTALLRAKLRQIDQDAKTRRREGANR